MSGSQHTIAGTVITMPVRIRSAQLHGAAFVVPAAAAQDLIAYSGLRVCEPAPGRAVVHLMLMEYRDGDLGRYLEFGTAVMVAPPGGPRRGPRALRTAGAFIHHLPVDGEFTLEAGRTIWGFPKILADFTVRRGPGPLSFDVSADGRLIAGMQFGGGLAVPVGAPQTALTAYSHIDGVTRATDWQLQVRRVRARPGGVRLWLGAHPWSRELAGLGLPRRAMTSVRAQVQMTFGDPTPVGDALS